jgi:hypothetical protein
MSEAYRKGFEDYLTGSPYDESYGDGSCSADEYQHGWTDGRDQKFKGNRHRDSAYVWAQAKSPEYFERMFD